MKTWLYALMDALMSTPGLVASIWVALLLASLGMMIGQIISSKGQRMRPAGLLMTGIAYAGANIAVFILTVMIDAFTIFQVFYILLAGFVAPALILSALIVHKAAHTRLSMLGFSLWICCVGFGHLFAIAIASAGV